MTEKFCVVFIMNSFKSTQTILGVVFRKIINWCFNTTLEIIKITLRVLGKCRIILLYSIPQIKMVYIFMKNVYLLYLYEVFLCVKLAPTSLCPNYTRQILICRTKFASICKLVVQRN